MNVQHKHRACRLTVAYVLPYYTHCVYGVFMAFARMYKNQGLIGKCTECSAQTTHSRMRWERASDRSAILTSLVGSLLNVVHFVRSKSQWGFYYDFLR